MNKQNRVHLVYTLQIKVKGTKHLGEPQIDDLVDSIDGTLKSWFPKGDVELVKHNVADGEKRVVITNVLPIVQRRTVQTNGKSIERVAGQAAPLPVSQRAEPDAEQEEVDGEQRA